MTYQSILPRQAEIREIARQMPGFPASAYQIIKKAQLYGYSDNLVAFLRLFYEGNQPEIFESREDFFVRATELAMLIREEREQPAESLLSPQG